MTFFYDFGTYSNNSIQYHVTSFSWTGHVIVVTSTCYEGIHAIDVTRYAIGLFVVQMSIYVSHGSDHRRVAKPKHLDEAGLVRY